MAMSMARTLARTNTSRCCLSSGFIAHSDGRTHLPVRRWEEGMTSKPLWRSLEQQESPAASGGGIQGPPPPPPPLSYYGCRANPPRPPPSPSPYQKFVDMGWLRPCNIPYEFSEGLVDPGTPAPRWWEVKFKKPWRLPPGITDDDRPPPPPLNMLGSNSKWEGRLKRLQLGNTFDPYPFTRVQDVVVDRVLSIAAYFKAPQHTYDLDIDFFGPEQYEYWLDEIQGYFEFMELAHELHSIDCLFPLLHRVLVYPHAACIRAKTAELVTTMVHNNPKSQQLVMGLHGLQPLWYNFTSDPDATSRTKALGAISALIRNNKPGITAFRETHGYAALGDALSSENVWFQREALNLIQYLLHENSLDCDTATELGLHRSMMHLASGDDAEVRVAALRSLLILTRDKGGNSGQLVKNDDKLKQVLQELINRISAMASEDLISARGEIQLVDSLWNACYNEPSSLKLFDRHQELGLLWIGSCR